MAQFGRIQGTGLKKVFERRGHWRALEDLNCFSQRCFLRIEGGVCHGSHPFRAFHTVQ